MSDSYGPWDRDSLPIGSAFEPKPLESRLSCWSNAAVYKIRSDHESRAPFACLAVHCNDILWVLREPLVDVGAKLGDELQGTRVVVVKGESAHTHAHMQC